MTLYNLGGFAVGAALAALLLVVDLALAIQSHFILLDAMLVYFIALTICFYSAFATLPAKYGGSFGAQDELSGACT